jgi:2'-hydroxyisoflavone reductase
MRLTVSGRLHEDPGSAHAARAMERRSFLRLAAASALTAPLAGCAFTAESSRPRRLLVLGGTNFVGPAVVERAVQRGHEVTLFNRGLTRPDLFPQLEALRGERALGGGDLSALAGPRRWDAVIDVWPEHSALVDSTARLLSDRVDYAFFVSSIAVYTDFSRPGLTEDSAVHRDDPGWYGGEKVLAEQALARAFPGRAGVARCHAILGPRDDGSAYPYWLRRLARPQPVIAPGAGDDPVQFVDVRDVARWIVDCVEQRRDGVHNLTGPAEPHTFRAFLEGTRDALQRDAELVWMDADWLRGQGVRSFDDMPLWAPLDEDAGFQQIRSDKALAAGLQLRPLAETARDGWSWLASPAFDGPASGQGLSRAREEALLAAWAARS